MTTTQRSFFTIRRRTVCHILAGVFSLFIVAPTAVMVFDRAPVIQFSRPAEIIPQPIKPDGTATIVWSAAQLRVCSGRVKRQVVHKPSGRITDYEWQEVVSRGWELGVVREYSRPFTVPSLPGIYIHRIYVERWCNPLQALIPALRIQEEAQVIEFEVR